MYALRTVNRDGHGLKWTRYDGIIPNKILRACKPAVPSRWPNDWISHETAVSYAPSPHHGEKKNKYNNNDGDDLVSVGQEEAQELVEYFDIYSFVVRRFTHQPNAYNTWFREVGRSAIIT